MKTFCIRRLFFLAEWRCFCLVTTHLVGAFHGVGLLPVRDSPEEQGLRGGTLDGPSALHAQVDLLVTGRNNDKRQETRDKK